MRFSWPIGLFVVFVIPYISVHAAHISLEAEQETYNTRDIFYVPIYLNTQNECTNAVRVAIAYNPEQLSVQDVSIGDSLLTLWTQRPTIKHDGDTELGRVVFEGGIPGGYCGRVEGDPGRTNVLAKLVVTGNTQQTTTSPAQIIVEPDDTTVYLHDGSGREAPLTVSGVTIAFEKATTSPENTWLEDVKSDVFAPELFDITLVEGPSVGNKKHYIAFNTVDKQSGIDHYEVLETDPDRFGFLTWVPKESYWVHAESPYVLRDQKLHSKILVKAVDKNGNERIVTYTPPMSPLEEIIASGFIFVTGVALTVIVVLVLIFILIRRRIQIKQAYHKETDLSEKHDEQKNEHEA